MKIVVATNPAHDTITRYLEAFLEDTFKSIRGKAHIKFFELKNEDANRENLTKFIENEDPNLVILNGHGSHDRICGFENCILIKADDNENILKKRVIHSLSCDSGKSLGPKCVKIGTLVFMGFEKEFKMYHAGQKTIEEKKKDEMAKLFLCPVVEAISALLNGEKAEEAFNRSQNKYRENLSILIASDNEKLSVDVASAIYHNMKYQVCLGDRKASF